MNYKEIVKKGLILYLSYQYPIFAIIKYLF
jgi:hypothetical protein